MNLNKLCNISSVHPSLAIVDLRVCGLENQILGIPPPAPRQQVDDAIALIVPGRGSSRWRRSIFSRSLHGRACMLIFSLPLRVREALLRLKEGFLRFLHRLEVGFALAPGEYRCSSCPCWRGHSLPTVPKRPTQLSHVAFPRSLCVHPDSVHNGGYLLRSIHVDYHPIFEQDDSYAMRIHHPRVYSSICGWLLSARS